MMTVKRAAVFVAVYLTGMFDGDIAAARTAGLISIDTGYTISKELYDLKVDLYEIHNLAKDPAYARTKQRLAAALTKWQDEIDDKGRVMEDHAIAPAMRIIGTVDKSETRRPQSARSPFVSRFVASGF